MHKEDLAEELAAHFNIAQNVRETKHGLELGSEEGQTLVLGEHGKLLLLSQHCLDTLSNEGVLVSTLIS